MEHFRPRILIVEYKKNFKKQGLDIYLAFEQVLNIFGTKTHFQLKYSCFSETVITMF